MTTYEFVDSMGVPVWMSGFDALIDAIDILTSALQNNESPTIVDINRKLCVKYHTSAIAMDRLLRRAVDYAVIRKQTHGPLYYEVLGDTPRQAMPLKQFLYISARYLMREEGNKRCMIFVALTKRVSTMVRFGCAFVAPIRQFKNP